MNKTSLSCLLTILGGTILLGGCTPTVRVEAPQKPITINLNVKVQQEIRVKVAKDVDQLFKEKKGIF